MTNVSGRSKRRLRLGALLLALMALLAGLDGRAQDEEAPTQSASVERGSLITFGGDVELAANERTDNIVVFGGEVTVSGQVRHSVVAVGGRVQVSGRVGDAVVSVGQDVVLEPGAVVNGDVVSVGGNVRRDPDATVRGDVTTTPWRGLGESWEELAGLGILAFLGFSVWRLVAWVIVMFAIGWVLLSLLPQPMARQTDALRSHPMTVVGWGALALLLFVPLVVVMVFTILGIFLIPVLVLAYVYAAIVGVIVAARVLGQRLSEPLKRDPFSPAAALAVGVVTLGLFRLIPVLGAIVTLALWLLGFGMTIVTRFGTRAYGQSRAPAPDVNADARKE